MEKERERETGCDREKKRRDRSGREKNRKKDKVEERQIERAMSGRRRQG